MSEIKEYIEKIVNEGTPDDMYKLSDMLDNLMKELEYYDKDCYKKYKMELYEIAYGEQLSNEIKEKWVNTMKPAAKWSLKEIENIVSQYNINIPIYSMYVIMNMFYSDMGNVLGFSDDIDTLEKYIQISNDWYYDEDATNNQEAKLYYYWKSIIN